MNIDTIATLCTKEAIFFLVGGLSIVFIGTCKYLKKIRKQIVTL